MGWVKVSSQEGATDWRIFRMVMKEIEDGAQRARAVSAKEGILHGCRRADFETV